MTKVNKTQMKKMMNLMKAGAQIDNNKIMIHVKKT